MQWQRKTIDKQKREEAISINSYKAVGLILLSSIIVEKNLANITYTPCVWSRASQCSYVRPL